MASSTDATRLRVCVLAKANPFIWVHHYVNAFRRHCDVITAGTSLSAEDLERMGRGHLAHLVRPNDIDTEINNIETLLERLPVGWRPDLIVTIQSGSQPVERIDWVTCPTAYISIDTWHDFAELIHALPYDFVFAAQREFAGHFTAAGHRNAHWLPLACDPEAHYPVAIEKEFDVGFVGSVDRSLHAGRAERLNRLAEHFSVFVGSALDSAGMCAAFSRARLGFNSSIAQDVNMRVFEVMAMGIPILTNRDADVNGLLDLFADAEHVIAYTDDTLINLAARYLSDAAARDRIAARGRAAVLEHHTYDVRVRHLIDVISAQVNWEALRERPLLRARGSLMDYLPTVPGHVADFDMSAGISKYALRRAGAARVTGLACETADAAVRHHLYDAVVEGDVIERESNAFDTVLLCSSAAGSVLPDSVHRVHRLLRPGGTIVAGLSARDGVSIGGSQMPEAVWRALEQCGFAMLRLELVETAHDDDIAMYATARKRTRTLKEIARGVYTRNPVPGLILDEVLSRLP
ncbi:MAG: glycosyltransferase [Candidatus Hydrogenedentes bacterium]|nr:glycosyltransferase [Candidatus Hydrogenedentota bacterium]